MVKAKKVAATGTKSWDKPIPDTVDLIVKLTKQKRPQYFIAMGHWNLESVCNRAMAEQVKKVPVAKQVELRDRNFERGFVVKKNKVYERVFSVAWEGAKAATFYFLNYH